MRSVSGCNVMVTGGAGFLGSHLVNHLIDDRGCRVLIVDNLVSGKKEFIHPRATFEHCDITGSESHIYRLLKKYGIQFVFQYAASPYIPVSFERPLHVFNVNAFGAMKVINAAHEAGCDGILQVSSAEIYGDAKGTINEEEPVRPHSTYGAAKAAVDNFVQCRWAEAQVPVIALRQFNCIGERDFCHPYVVPEIILQIKQQTSMISTYSGERPTVQVHLGNNSFRDFQYAGDAVRIAVELLERGEFGEVYNSGSEDGIQIYDLARLIGSLMNVNVEVVPDQSRIRPWEIWTLRSDCSKLYSTINRFPVVKLEDALKRTIDSIRKVFWSLEWFHAKV